MHFALERKPPLNNAVPPRSRRSRLRLERSNRAFLQQARELPHSILHHNLGIAFDEDIQFGLLAWLGLLAFGVEGALVRDGCAGRFEDLGHVGAVRDAPAGLLGEVVDFERGVESAGVGPAVVDGCSWSSGAYGGLLASLLGRLLMCNDVTYLLHQDGC